MDLTVLTSKREMTTIDVAKSGLSGSLRVRRVRSLKNIMPWVVSKDHNQLKPLQNAFQECFLHSRCTASRAVKLSRYSRAAGQHEEGGRRRRTAQITPTRSSNLAATALNQLLFAWSDWQATWRSTSRHVRHGFTTFGPGESRKRLLPCAQGEYLVLVLQGDLKSNSLM